jgi:hypothetical protein
MTTAVLDLLDDPYVIFAGWGLLVILWESALVGCVFAVWSAAHPEARVTARYRAAMLALTVAAAAAAMTPLGLYGLGTHRQRLLAHPEPPLFRMPTRSPLPARSPGLRVSCS